MDEKERLGQNRFPHPEILQDVFLCRFRLSPALEYFSLAVDLSQVDQISITGLMHQNQRSARLGFNLPVRTTKATAQ